MPQCVFVKGPSLLCTENLGKVKARWDIGDLRHIKGHSIKKGDAEKAILDNRNAPMDFLAL